MPTSARELSETPSRSPSPSIPVQPDHFYGSEGVPLPPSPESDGRTWLNPNDDPYASRGIPVFKPSMEEFQDFEGYMNKIECWGMRSGIVKVIPPKEWKDALPSITEQLAAVKLKSPIEQHMLGNAGRYLQQNMEKRRTMSVREWAELCEQEDLRAPGVDDVGLHHAPRNEGRSRRRKKTDATNRTETAEPDAAVEVKTEIEGDGELPKAISDGQPSYSHESSTHSIPTPAASVAAAEEPIDKDHSTKAASPSPSVRQTLEPEEEGMEEAADEKPKTKGKGGRQPRTKEMREASLAQRQAKDAIFLENFDPDSDWLPSNTTPFDYTPEFCSKLERQYWRNLGFGKPAWYGADMQGSLFTDETTVWNVAHLPSTLSRILPSSSNGLPGVNTPYLYFGMWRATFAWHVEDMDLFSINYIHFGAGKFWYAVPQGRAGALEQTMRGYFPDGPSKCPQFLRHKSYLASPNLLAKASCRPNTLVQNAGEFVITYPRGYHAGFNLGFNCAESVNFALESWLELGRKAKACQCISDSVRIDVDELLREREAERLIEEARLAKASKSKKRKSEEGAPASKSKKAKTKSKPESKTKPDSKSRSKSESKASSSGTASQPRVSLTIKLGPKSKAPEPFPCCLCCSMDTNDLLPVQDPPTATHAAYAEIKVWRAHEECANVLPETWVDEIEIGGVSADGMPNKAKAVFGVDAIVKDRWNLKCSACTKNRPKMHGAPVQCTKGKCSKAFHVSCARDGAANNIVYRTLGFVEKEVVFTEPPVDPASMTQPPYGPAPMDVDYPFGNTPGGDMAVDTPDPSVYKTIRKLEIELMCPLHNPAVTEAKKASKQDKIRNQLLALEPMTRIKIRVSAGVFEVSLCRVLDENKSVEVLWDKGVKREFKWGSVVFGSTEGQTVGQMPTEPVATPDTQLLQTQLLQRMVSGPFSVGLYS
ncbi:JmjC-domain-containing protein [Dentipellis sp. KUC8613]|nr:JmjC-domain-containing protein [Dentipellis sp. KUC8613]